MEEDSDAEEVEFLELNHGPNVNVHSLDLFANRLLVGGFSNSHIHIWSPWQSTRVVQDWIVPFTDEISSVKFFNDHEVVTSGGTHVCGWDLRYISQNNPAQPLFHHELPSVEDINCIAVCTDTDSVMVSGDSGDVIALQPVHVMKPTQSSWVCHSRSIGYALAYSHKHKLCVSGGMDCGLAVVNVADSKSNPAILSLMDHHPAGELFNPPQVHSVSVLNSSATEEEEFSMWFCCGAGNGTTQLWLYNTHTHLFQCLAGIPESTNSPVVGCHLSAQNEDLLVCSAYAHGKLALHRLHKSLDNVAYIDSVEFIHDQRLHCLSSSILDLTKVPVGDCTGRVLLVDMT